MIAVVVVVVAAETCAVQDNTVADGRHANESVDDARRARFEVESR